MITIFISVPSIFPQEKESTPTETKTIIREDTISAKSPPNIDFTKEDILMESQRNLDRSISILNTVATLMGVLVGLLTLIFVIGGVLGIFEYRRLRETHQSLEESAQEAKSIVSGLKKTEQEVNKIRSQISIPSLPEAPTEELKDKLDELSRKIEILEAFGAPLKGEDYFARGVNLYLRGKFEMALKAFEKAIELKPDYAEAWYNKSCAYSLKGDKENALKSLSKAIELDHHYKEMAKEDEDFKTLWDDEDFKEIVS